MPSSFYSLQPQNNLPIISSHGNSPLGYHPTFGHYPLTPVPPLHSTEIPSPASSFQPSAPLPTTRTFTPLAPSAIPPTDPSAAPHMESSPPINATPPNFAVRQQQQQDAWHVAITNSGSNRSRGRGGRRARGGRRSVSARAATPSSDFHGSQRTSTSTPSRTHSGTGTPDPAID